MKNQLLKNILYGNELEALATSNPDLRLPHDALVPAGSEGDWDKIIASTQSFFRNRKAGVFGGPITAGDALFIASYMARERPSYMVEIGVASGFSSAFILHMAKELNLLSDDTFLHSFDITHELPDGRLVGQYTNTHFPDLAKHWALHTRATSLDILKDGFPGKPQSEGRVLALVDGGHQHPWPMIDVLMLSKELPSDSWVLLQDYQMLERWFADSIEFGVPMNTVVRGVNLAVALWPGEKFIGTGMAYNMAAIKIADPKVAEDYIQLAKTYAFEAQMSDEEFDTAIK